MDYIAQFKKEVTIILLGAGDSTRFSRHHLPKKQWLRIQRKPLWKHLVDFFLQIGFDHVLVTASQEDIKFAQNFYPNVIEGGSSRTQSILNALQRVTTKYVLIHDVARFNPQINVIQNLLKTLFQDPQIACVAPRLKVSDTLYHCGRYPNREDFYLIQTPQLSNAQILEVALKQRDFSDESSAMQALNQKIAFVEGSSLMLKLTYPQDLAFLKQIYPEHENEILIGGGIDIHGFEENKKMVLCGVEIQSSMGFKAHSDGDVAIHSLIDALLGAIGAGDIGEWFPDTLEQYRNIDSKVLLQKVVAFIRKVGYDITNIDLTILAQNPKITPYKKQMQESLANLLGIESHRINIKATTAENLGFVGRNEGICVLSHISLYTVDWRKNENFNH